MNFCALADHILLKILSFLEFSDIYSNCIKSCKYISRFIFSQKNVPIELIRQIIGYNLSENTRNNWNYTDALNFLKPLVTIERNDYELSFYGYKGNCGCDENDPRYLFTKIFREQTGFPCCTIGGENFWIKGALSYDYYKYGELIKKKTEIGFDELELADAVEYITSKKEDVYSLMEKNLSSQKDYSFEYKQLPRIAIIKSLKISRSGQLSCPVKTLMIFSSMEEISENDPLVMKFNKCTSKAKLRELCNSNPKQNFPSIFFTNIKYFEKDSCYFDNKTSGISFVMFSNLGKNKIKPMIWIKYNDLKRKEFAIRMLNKNFFTARYLFLKLYNCDDNREEMHDFHDDTNIDIKFISLKGSLMPGSF